MSHHPSNEIDRYPIGRYTPPSQITAAHRTEWIECLSRLPSEVQRAVAGLSADQLASPYRVGGWTVRQVVHHLPDSHLNSYIRFRLALTEDDPAIRPYDEAAWAELTDARSASVELSLALLEALHARWLVLLHALTEEQWARTIRHPQLGQVNLAWMLGLYAWHGRHHCAQIEGLRARRGW